MLMFSFKFNHVLSQNLVKNPGFETGFLSPYWGSWPIGTSLVNIDVNNAFTGEFCAKLENNEVYFYQPVNLEPFTSNKNSPAKIKEPGEDITLSGIRNLEGKVGKNTYFLNDANYDIVSFSFTSDENPDNKSTNHVWNKDESLIASTNNIEVTFETEPIEPKPPKGFSSFYVSPQGNDSNTGTSPNQAWKTIDKINSRDFGPGDEIFFEGSQTFNGTIFIDQNDSGTIENKVTISSYGMGRATINGGSGSGFIATDCDNIILKSLNFKGIGRKDGNTKDGVVFNRCSNIVIDSLEISGFQHSGLVVMNEGKNFNITNVNAHDNGFAGIFLFGDNKESLSQIRIAHCIADNNPGDPTVTDNHSGNGILGYKISNLIIEYCKASNNGWDMPRKGNGPGGIWVAEADSVLIQYCISHDNKTSPDAKDGLGFDFDGGVTNSLIQYCLSYNNHGAGYGIYQYSNATNWYNNTIRYCISENDGNVSGGGSVEIWNGTEINSDFSSLQFYNNVIYNEIKPALYFINNDNSDFNFRNNIFVSGSGKVYDQMNQENFQGNNWYTLSNNSTQDSLDFITWALVNKQEMLNGSLVGIYANPRFINPGNSTLTDPLLLETVDDYKVIAGSVVIDKGLDLESLFSINPGNRDYFGNLIKQGMAFNMGVDQFADKQEISFGVGWNIFSANLAPNDSNLMNILQPLINAGKLKKVMDEAGNAIEDRGIFGGWTNGIGNIKTTEGYAINVTSQSTLEIYGNPFQLPIEIPLSKGWNIISWPAQFAQNGMDVFQTLIDEGKLKKVMNEEGQTIEDWGTFGGWISSIGNFTPGEGYKVNVTDDCTLTVDENIVKSQAIIPKSKTTTHFIPSYIGNGFSHMNINVVNLPVNVLNTGDELAVFDKDICVGAVKIQDHHLRNFSVSIVTSASDNTGMKGFTEGNSFSLKLWDSRQNREIVLEPEILKGTSTFAKNETTFASLEKYVKTGLEGIYGSNYNEINCFPNPFSDEITIEIILGADSDVFVEVLNQLGQQVKILYPQNELNKGNHQIKWNGKNGANQNVPAGIYFVRAIIGNKILFDKVVYK
jgi:hypothetical protein